MKAGDRVMIYEDPLTKKKQEGMATLMELQACDPGDGRLEYWLVHFDGDKGYYYRTIYPGCSSQ